MTYDNLTSTVVPIQGTFDIARARNSIRAMISLRRWSANFNARAATALTALGELILLTGGNKTVPIRVEIHECENRCGIMLSCTVEASNSEPARWEAKQNNLRRAVDEFDIEEKISQLRIAVWVWQ